MLGGDERRVCQEADQGRHEVQEGGPVRLHQLHKGLRLELRQHDVLDALVQPAGHGHVQAEDVEEGEDADSCVLNMTVILEFCRMHTVPGTSRWRASCTQDHFLHHNYERKVTFTNA